MKTRAQEVIDQVQNLDVEEDKKSAMIEKIREWQTDEHAQSNKLAVVFEKFWAELEPIFAEMGWV